MRRVGRPVTTGTTLTQLERRLGSHSPEVSAYLRAHSRPPAATDRSAGPAAAIGPARALRRALAQGLGLRRRRAGCAAARGRACARARELRARAANAPTARAARDAGETVGDRRVATSGRAAFEPRAPGAKSVRLQRPRRQVATPSTALERATALAGRPAPLVSSAVARTARRSYTYGFAQPPRTISSPASRCTDVHVRERAAVPVDRVLGRVAPERRPSCRSTMLARPPRLASRRTPRASAGACSPGCRCRRGARSRRPETLIVSPSTTLTDAHPRVRSVAGPSVCV